MIAFAILSDTSQAHPSARLNAMTLSGPLVLPGDQVRNDRVAIRIGGVRLHKGVPVLAKVAEHKMKVVIQGQEAGTWEHFNTTNLLLL
jgi:hypothetical protein